MTDGNMLVNGIHTAALSPLVRVFGDLRLQTAGDLLAMTYSSAGVIHTVEEPGVLRRWNLDTGRPENSAFLSDLETVWTFCPEGKALITASDEVSIWDVANGDLITSLLMPSWVTTLAVRRTPALIATGHDEGVVRLWDPAGHRLVRELAGHDRPITAIAFSPDGHRIATAGEDRTIHIWDVASGRQLGLLGRHTDHICSLLWHPGERLLFSAAWDRTARIWDTDTLEPIMLLNSHADQLIAMAIDPAGRFLACADSAPSVRLWEIDSFQELAVLPGITEEVRCLAFSPDGHQLATGSTSGRISLWDPHDARLLTQTQRATSNRVQTAISPNGARLMCLDAEGSLRIWDVLTGDVCQRVAEANSVNCFALSPDGSTLALAIGSDIVLRAALTGEFRLTLKGQRGRVAALAFAPDSATLATASADDGTVWLWNVFTAEPNLLIPFAADACTLETLAFHPKGHLLAVGGIDWLATGGSDGAIGIWDIPKREALCTFNRGARSLAFHPNGRWLAAASLDRGVHVWDLQTRQLLHHFPDHEDAVHGVAFSPDGRCLVSSGDDRAVRVWDVETGDQIATRRVDAAVKALAFSHDGRFLFSGNANATGFQIDFARLLDESDG